MAHAGRRDSYQVARAFAEHGELKALVTDRYVRSSLARIAGLMPLAKLQKGALYSAKGIHMSSVVRVRARSLSVSQHDDAIGVEAADLAVSTNSTAVIYSYHWPGYVSRAPRVAPCSVLFQVHPIARQVQEIVSRERLPGMESLGIEAEELVDAEGVMREEADLQLADRIVVASSVVADGLIRAGCASNKVRVVPYGFPPTGDFRLRSSHEERVRLLTVSQATFRKNLHSLFELMCLPSMRRHQLTLVTRGGDERLLRGAPVNVKVLTDLSERELQRQYAAADIFVLPSFLEGFGLVYLEAMSHGLPVVGGRNTGLPDVMSDGLQGFILDRPHVNSLARALGKLIASPELRATMSRAAWELARTRPWSRYRRDLRAAIAQS